MCSFARAAITSLDNRRQGLDDRNFWKLKVQDQGASRGGSFQGLWERIFCLPLSWFWQPRVFLDLEVAFSLTSPRTIFLYVCLALHMSSLWNDTSHTELAPIPQ